MHPLSGAHAFIHTLAIESCLIAHFVTTFVLNTHSNTRTMALLLKDKTLMKMENGEVKSINAEEHLRGKVVALYFSAHWCPPCRNFTPVLKDFYEEVGQENFEVVFVSFDHSANDLKEYMQEAHGDWCFIPFGNPLIKELSQKYGVQGIPALIIIKAAGDTVTKNARSDVMGQASKSPAQLLAEWKTACAD
uniref:protein-disulfide reductase n=1 Tax=Trichuris muris TaxID=70415 RepID=A0A5S6R3X3_TRIMR